MELRQIRYFVTVAEVGSLTTAAAKLYVSQPALTENIKNLEDELGGKLFYRSQKGMVLTNTGTAFLAYANSLLNLASKAASVVSDAEEKPTGAVTFMLPTSIGSLMTAELFSAASKLYPDIELRLIEFTTDFTKHIFATNLCDFVVTFDIRNPDNLNIRPLFKEKLYLVTKFVAEAKLSQLEFSALGEYPLMSPHKYRGIFPILTELAKNHGVELNFSTNSAPYSILLRLAEIGASNILSPYPPIDDLVKSKRISVFEIINPEIYRQLNLVWPKDKLVSNAAEKIMALTQDMIIKHHNGINQEHKPATV